MYLADEPIALGGFAAHVPRTREGQRNPARAQVESDGRVAELELENERLQRLVAELLLTNQRLRGTN